MRVVTFVGHISFGVIFPPVLVLYTGQELALICTSVKEPTWKREQYPIPKIFFEDGGRKLRIKSASPRCSGRYTCSGTLPSGREFQTEGYVAVGGEY